MSQHGVCSVSTEVIYWFIYLIFILFATPSTFERPCLVCSRYPSTNIFIRQSCFNSGSGSGCGLERLHPSLVILPDDLVPLLVPLLELPALGRLPHHAHDLLVAQQVLHPAITNQSEAAAGSRDPSQPITCPAAPPPGPAPAPSSPAPAAPPAAAPSTCGTLSSVHQSEASMVVT